MSERRETGSETNETRWVSRPLRARAVLTPAQEVLQAVLAIREAAGRPLLTPGSLIGLASQCEGLARNLPDEPERRNLERYLLCAAATLTFRAMARAEVQALQAAGREVLLELRGALSTEGAQTAIVLSLALHEARAWARRSFHVAEGRAR